MAALAEKDLAWALQLARKSDVSLPVTALVSQLAAGIYGVPTRSGLSRDFSVAAPPAP